MLWLKVMLEDFYKRVISSWKKLRTNWVQVLTSIHNLSRQTPLKPPLRMQTWSDPVHNAFQVGAALLGSDALIHAPRFVPVIVSVVHGEFQK